MKSSFGSVLSEWRAARRLSQLGLALLTGVSQRHISFVESGRAQPSRDTIFKLADGLDLSLRARNDLFLAAGYAPAYAERRLELAEMMAAREALEMILRHHEPYPAVVMDAGWNIVMQNAAASRIIAHCVGTDALRQLFPNGIVNFMQLMFSENGLRPHIRNWTHTRLALLKRLRREAAANPASPSEALRRGFGSEEQTAGEAVINDESLDPMLSLELRVGDSLLRLFNTFTTFGTPQDVSLQELRIDMSFPADEATRRFLDAAANDGIQGASGICQDA
ncbi:MAG: helix-turn-helix transcriptional regulator [Bradyrhizobium sp.]